MKHEFGFLLVLFKSMDIINLGQVFDDAGQS